MFKNLAKKLVKKHHWSYLSWYRSHFGWRAAVRAYLNLFVVGPVGTAPNPLTGGAVYIRPGTADQCVYQQIFVYKDYDFNLGDPKFIVDAGAHIGLSSVFFASKYPKAMIIALEPEPKNFEILCKNANSHRNIQPLQAGLWSNRTNLQIQDSSVDTWSFRVSEIGSNDGIAALGIPDIKSEYKLPRIDVLKIDVEGSEVEILNNSEAWLGSVGSLIIELHDRFRPGCSEALSNALKNFSFEQTISRENIVVTNIQPRLS